MLLFIKRKVPDVLFITAKNRASKGNGSWKNYSKEKTAITFGEECTSELSTIILPTKVRLILEVLQYIKWLTYTTAEIM